jgi:hypothetical protein
LFGERDFGRYEYNDYTETEMDYELVRVHEVLLGL